MKTATIVSKLRPTHLERQAFVYVRQSTRFQVREHTASTARQHDLVQRACDLGWPRESSTVIDQDQGHSGASATGRTGFQFLVAEVGLGHAGAVCSLEMSRLARASSAWYRLREICALTDTLVIDEQGIYDPGQYSDRLLLGFMGTMREAELHWLRHRLLGGKLEKAQQGTLRFRPPTGLLLALTGQIGLDPDDEIQHAVRLVFESFAHHGSALAVVRHFQAHGLRFPTRLWGKRQGHEVRWGPLTPARVLAVLHNPAYADTYVYGRPHTRTQVLPGEAPRVKGRPRTVAPADWPVVHREAHPGYCTWEQGRQTQHQLDDNRTFRPEDRRGAVREGAALLQGLVLCGQWGRRMRGRSLADGTRPCYACVTLHVRQAGPTWQSIRGDGVDAAVTQLFLEALTPAQVAVSLATLEQVEAQARQIARQWQLRLERAQYEADLARRRFLAVEPEHRLVARPLERDWNDKLAALATWERERAASPPLSAQLVSPSERQRLLALAQDVPAVWQACTTPPAERKQLLRCRIKDVTLLKHPQTIEIAVRWQPEACTRGEVPRPARAADVRRTAPAVVERIRTLAPHSTDSAIAQRLNQDGASPGLGGTFSAAKVAWVRYAYGMAPGCPEAPGRCPTGQRGDGRDSARAAAELLNVEVGTIADWCQAGQLDCLRKTSRSPRWILLPPALIAALRKPVRQRKPRRRSHE